MKKNLWLSFTSGALLIAASGCLKEDAKPDAQQPIGVDPRAALIKALDNQATTLVNGLNKVLIEGKFLQNMTLANPPQPIPLSDDNEINKAIGYLLSSQTQQGNSYSYKPDSRICSEVMAKNSPATCIEVMKQVSLTQTPANDTDGTLEIAIGNARPFYISYGESAVSVRATLAEMVKAMGEVDQVLKQNGEIGMTGPLPTTFDGAFELTATSFMSVSNLRFSITSAVDLRGQNENAEAYSLQIAEAQGLLNVSLNPMTGIGAASASLPSVAASFSVHNDQNIAHEIQVFFPGLSGAATLDNTLEQIALQAVKLAAPDVYVTVDGQLAAHISSASQINAQIQSYVNGDKSVSFSSEFSAQAEITANALINGNGLLSASVAQGTELYFKMNSTQAQLVSGSVQLIGTDSFNGMMDAQQGACIEGQQNAAIPLQTVACQ